MPPTPQPSTTSSQHQSRFIKPARRSYDEIRRFRGLLGLSAKIKTSGFSSTNTSILTPLLVAARSPRPPLLPLRLASPRRAAAAPSAAAPDLPPHWLRPTTTPPAPRLRGVAAVLPTGARATTRESRGTSISSRPPGTRAMAAASRPRMGAPPTRPRAGAPPTLPRTDQAPAGTGRP